eukprot:UC1_evm1s2043
MEKESLSKSTQNVEEKLQSSHKGYFGREAAPQTGMPTDAYDQMHHGEKQGFNPKSKRDTTPIGIHEAIQKEESERPLPAKNSSVYGSRPPIDTLVNAGNHRSQIIRRTFYSAEPIKSLAHPE